MASFNCDCEVAPALEKSMTFGTSDEYAAMTSNKHATSPLKASLGSQLSSAKQMTSAGDGAMVDDSSLDRSESQQSTATNFSCDSLLSTSSVASTQRHGWDVQAFLPNGVIADLETGAAIQFAYAKEFASSHEAKLVAKSTMRARRAAREALAAHKVEAEDVCSLDASGTLRGPIAFSPAATRAEHLKVFHRKRQIGGRLRGNGEEQPLLCVGADGRVRLFLHFIQGASRAKMLSLNRASSTSSAIFVVDQDGLVQDCQVAGGDNAEDGGEAEVEPNVVAVTPEGSVVGVDSSAAPVFLSGNTMPSQGAKEKAKAGVRRMREWELVAAANKAEARLEEDEVFSIDSDGMLRGPVAAIAPQWASFDANGVVRAPRFNGATARMKLFFLKKRFRNRPEQRDGEGALTFCVDCNGRSFIYVPLSSEKKRSNHQKRNVHRKGMSACDVTSSSVLVVDRDGLVQDCHVARGDYAEEAGEAEVKPNIVAVTPEGSVVDVDGGAAPVLLHGNTMPSQGAKESAKAGVRRMREWETVAAANKAEARLEEDEVFSLDSDGMLRGPVAAVVPRWASFDANGVVRAPRFNGATARMKLFFLKKRFRNRREHRGGEGALTLCVDTDGRSCIYVPLSSEKKRSNRLGRIARREEVKRCEAAMIVDEAGVVHE